MAIGYNTYHYYYGKNGVEGFTIDHAQGGYFFGKNLQGDITEIYRSSDGWLVGKYVYDAWGNCTIVLDTNGVASANPFRYRGYYFDTETGLYYVKSRYYDPKTGRWISPEPNLLNGGFDTGAGIEAYNAYAYCANNPVIAVDRDGQAVSVVFVELLKILFLTICVYAIMQTVVVNPPKAPSIDLPEIDWDKIKRKIQERVKAKETDIAIDYAPSIPKPSDDDYGKTYYHSTTFVNAMAIKTSGIMKGSIHEGGFIYAWQRYPSKYALENSGAHFGVVISFKTKTSFVSDMGITDPEVTMYGPVVSLRPGPIQVYDVEFLR